MFINFVPIVIIFEIPCTQMTKLVSIWYDRPNENLVYDSTVWQPMKIVALNALYIYEFCCKKCFIRFDLL